MNLKRETRRMICALLIAAMMCSDAGVTAYAVEAAEQGALTEIADETVSEEVRAETGQDGVESAGDSQEEQPVTGEERTEEEGAEAEKTKEPSQKDDSVQENPAEETKREEENGDTDSDTDKETEVEGEEPSEEDTMPEEDSDGVEDAENPEDISPEESVSGNSVIAQGEYKEDGNNITWVIDADGKLTVEGTGEFASSTDSERAPWYESKEFIKTAQINVSDMTNASWMFFECSNLTSVDVSGFDTSKVTYMGGMFSGCGKLTNLNVGNFATGNVENMFGMFDGCRSLTSLNVSNFNTSNVTDMHNMFSGCNSLKRLDMGNFDTGKVIDMNSMFAGCINLTSLDVSSFNTGNVTFMYNMFNNCSSLTSLDVSNFDTSSVTNMLGMFSNCQNLTTIDVSSFKTSNVTQMGYMFNNCGNLITLDVGSFDTSKVTDMSCMFNDCKSLTILDLSSFDVKNMTNHVTSSGVMFQLCDKLQIIHTPYNLKLSVELPAGYWTQTDGTILTELPQDLDHSILIKKSAAIKVEKGKTKFACGDTINLDDITVTYYPVDGATHIIESGDYTTNADEIDMSVVGQKKLIITYRDGDKVFTDSIELTVEKLVLHADNLQIMLVDADGLVYDGAPKTPEVTVVCTISGNAVDDGSVSENSISRESVSDNSIVLEKDKDYTVTYENNINAFEDSEALVTAQNAPKVVVAGQNRYRGAVNKAFAIQKAAAPQAEECLEIKDFSMGQSGCTVDLSDCFADYQKTGYTTGKPIEDDTVAGNVIAGQPSVDEKGILTYQTLAGTKGDFAVIPVTVSFVNYKDAVLRVKIMLGGDRAETVAMPIASPESGRQLTAGSKVTLSCETAGAKIYYMTSVDGKGLTNPIEKGVLYTEPITVDGELYVRAAAVKGANQSRQVTFHYTVLNAANKVMQPYADPGQGVVGQGTEITLKCDTPDAAIYYLTGANADVMGAVPVDETHRYTQPIVITKDTVIKAVAKKDGMEDSDAAVFVYRVNTKINAPTADPEPGMVDQGSYIALQADSGVNIYYTTDVSDPAVSGTAKLYEGKIRIDGEAGSVVVIRAVAENKGIYSETVTFTYTVSENKAAGLQVMLAGSEEYIYTGCAITPTVIVTNNGEELTEGEDYTVRYSSNVKAANKDARNAPKITVTGRGNLTKSRSITFTIKPKFIGDEEEVVGGTMVAVSGETASPVLFYGGVKLTTRDFDNPDAKKRYEADGTVTITGKGNFEGTRDIDVRVVKKEDMKKFTVAIDNVALKNEPLVYDGEQKTLDGYFEVYDTKDRLKTNPLEEYSDYTVIYPKNNIDAGKVKFTVVGLGEYRGTVTKSYTIKPRVVKTAEDGNMEVNVDDGEGYPFRNGGVTIPDLAVACDGDILIPGKDYKVTYSSNKKICTDNKAKCTISFKGNYKGSKAIVRKFHITPAVLDDVDQMSGAINVAVGDKVYTGKRGAYKSVPYVTADGVLLKSSDYRVSYYKDADREQVIDGRKPASSVDLQDKEKQTVYVKIEGRGNFGGTLTAEYNVYKLTGEVIDLSKAKVNIVGGDKKEYTGESVEPEIEVLYKAGREWKKVDANDIGTYVKVTYINNVNKGKATVMINGSGGYAGSKTAAFNIVPRSIK